MFNYSIILFLDANELCIEELVETITYSNSEKENNEPPLNIKAVNENYYEPSTFEPLTTTTSAHKPSKNFQISLKKKKLFFYYFLIYLIN